MSDPRPAPGDAGTQPGSGPDVADADEFAKMQAVMRVSESTAKAGSARNLRSPTQNPALAPEARPDRRTAPSTKPGTEA
jgi:hypothetical protein